MTPRQLLLARHALGLPNMQRRSYRNRYLATLGTPDYADWIDMATRGNAIRWPQTGSMDYFTLTLRGAQAALVQGEGLDPEDFPEMRGVA